jgi:hypothetical protein
MVRTSPSLSGVRGVHPSTWRALGDVGLALARIVGRQRPAHDLGARSRRRSRSPASNRPHQHRQSRRVFNDVGAVSIRRMTVAITMMRVAICAGHHLETFPDTLQ